jgi:hypothetical protein
MMMMMPLVKRLAPLAALFTLAAGCGGGGQSSPSPGGTATTDGGVGASDAQPTAPLPTTADDLFRPATDGFAFPNYADLPGPGVFDATALRRMFGDGVCSSVTNGACTLTPQAEDWADKVNLSLQGGHCEGFAVLSLLFFNKWLDPKPFGADTTGALVFTGNGALNHELAYWYATQYLEDPVITTTHSFTAMETVNYLLGELSDPMSEQSARIGLARVGANGALEGGHAITPYAVRDGDTPGTKKIMVYDSNHPGEEHAIVVDVAADSWSYVAGTDPQDPSSLYAGDLTNKNHLYVAAAHPRIGVHPCPFCSSSAAQTHKDPLGKGPADIVAGGGSRSLLVHGNLAPLVQDANGHRVGLVNGVVVNEVPGATVTPGFSGGLWSDNAPVQILLPQSGDFKVAVTPRAMSGGATAATKSSVTMFGSGYSLGVDYPAGAMVMGDTIGMPENAKGVTLTSVGSSPATLAMAVQTENGGIVAHIALASLPAGANIGLQTDGATGKVGVAVNSPSPVAVSMNVGIDKGDGTGKQVFEGAVASSGADTVGVDLGSWSGGTAPMPISVAPSDGSPPTVVVVDNSHDYTPPAVDECALGLSNCSINALCTDTPAAFTCACKPGYGGDGVSCIEGASTPTPPPPAAPQIAYKFPGAPALLYTVGTLAMLSPPVGTGGLVDSYAVTPALPAGLLFDPLTGAIRGTPTAVSAAATYTVTATNATGSATADLAITVQAAAPKIAYPAGNHALFRWDAAPILAPTNTGGPALAYAITPALPAGLTFDPATGQISGTPSALSPVTSYTITASNVSGAWPTALSLSVVCAGGATCDTPAGVVISGSATGLVGSGLVLQNNGADNLGVASNGSFQFASSVAPFGPYAVTVLTQPTSPTQVCTVTSGSGTVPLVDVANVSVACTTTSFTVGGTITGLLGPAILQDNAGNNLTVSSAGAFTFSSAVPSGAPYAVTVLNQPSSPVQVCSVSNGSGVVGGANVGNVAIACSTSTFTVAASVVGLTNSGLVLQDNGGDTTAVDPGTNGMTFAAPVSSGGAYVVSILQQPIGQTCHVTGGSGTIGSGNVATAVVNCATDTYTVGGTISGLSGTVILQDNAGDDLTLNGSGSFAFRSPIAFGDTYAITVLNQPSSPAQTCAITSGATGTMSGADVTNVVVACTTNSYSVGGTISGLGGTAVLQDNTGDNLTVTSNGAFTFPSPVLAGASFDVTVRTQPSSPAQTCTVVSGGAGVVGSSNVSSVSVSCTTNQYQVGGTVSGLNGTVVLQDNAGDDVSVSSDGSFSFATALASGTSYNATVLVQPASQTCSVSAASGTVTNAAVTSIVINCVTNAYTVGGSVSGATGSLTLQLNGGSDLVVSAGTFTFSPALASGQSYAVTISSSPPGQTCAVSSGSGTVANGAVSDVTVTCTTTPTTPVSCKAIKEATPGALDGSYTIDPDGPGGNAPLVVTCDMTTDGGGYTYYAVTGGISTSRYDQPNSCTAIGLNIVVPRTLAHLTAMYAAYGSGYFAVVPGVYGLAAGNYSGCALNSSDATCAANWKAIDGGAWFVKSVPYSEPNGDYTPGCWLSANSGVDGTGFTAFNDGNCGYETGAAYICSDNAK